MDDDEFRMTLVQMGYRIVNVRENGNCLYTAISFGLYGEGVDLQHLVRQQISAHSIANFAEYEDLIEVPYEPNVPGNRVLQQKIERIGHILIDHVWGGEESLKAAAELYGRFIVVEQPGQNPLIFQPIYQRGIPIYLSYHDRSHYNYLVRENGGPGSSSQEIYFHDVAQGGECTTTGGKDYMDNMDIKDLKQGEQPPMYEAIDQGIILSQQSSWEGSIGGGEKGGSLNECHAYRPEIQVPLSYLDEPTRNLIHVLESFMQRQIQEPRSSVAFRRLQFVPNEREEAFLRSNIYVTFIDIIRYACGTIPQFRSRLWFLIRRVRITSSRAYDIIRRKKKFEKLAYDLAYNNFSGNEATDYGQRLEGAARDAFKFDNKVSVIPSGVVISPVHPWLCCSPDGIVFDPVNPQGLEIKCPYSRKGKKILEPGNMKPPLDYLYFDGPHLRVKKKHKYYAQVQLCLFIQNLESCFFFVYSGKDRVQVLVQIDWEFLDNAVSRLEWFYYNYYLKVLMEKYRFNH